MNIDPKITNKVWRSMIKAFIESNIETLKKNNYLLCGGSFLVKIRVFEYWGYIFEFSFL